MLLNPLWDRHVTVSTHDMEISWGPGGSARASHIVLIARGKIGSLLQYWTTVSIYAGAEDRSLGCAEVLYRKLWSGPRNAKRAMEDNIRSWAPKVLMCQAILGVHGSLSYRDISKQSFDLFIELYDKGMSWNFHILFTFFSFVPKSGKRISVVSILQR